MESWVERQEALLRLARLQLFVVGGAPRSGTTWLQSVLDAHPAVSCRGEGFFWKQLAVPLEKLMAERRTAIEAKNAAIFSHNGGYPLPTADEIEMLLGTGVMLALERQIADKPCQAVGEKTPENIFFFPRLKRLFPNAKFIGIARDPRDLLCSAWHFFFKLAPGQDEAAAKTKFIADACGALDNGMRHLLTLVKDYPGDCMVFTYESMHAKPARIATELYRFLGVAADDALVADCVARTSFAAMSGRRQGESTQNGSFFRKGTIGDWQSTFTPAMTQLIMERLGWAFPQFGWTA